MSGADPDELRRRTAAFATDVAPTLALPGRGDTPARFAHLLRIGRGDLALARLCEAHADAVAILAEVGRPPAACARYGVWAARSRDEVVTATPRDGGWQLRGRKPWCSGVGLVSHALVTAETEDGPLLFELDLARPGVATASEPWSAAAFAATNTATVDLDLILGDDRRVGAVGAYLARPGFWHGACGVAACWAGGLLGVLDRGERWWRADPHATAHRGACDAHAWAVTELVAAAGRDADEHPQDLARARRTALRVRHLVDEAVTDVVRRVRRGCGPAPFAFDRDLDRTTAELELYVRQCHAERDLEALGRLLTDPPV